MRRSEQEDRSGPNPRPSTPSFYLRDSAAAPTRPPCTFGTRCRASPEPHPSPVPRLTAASGDFLCRYPIWYYLNTPRPGCQSCIFTKCPATARRCRTFWRFRQNALRRAYPKRKEPLIGSFRSYLPFRQPQGTGYLTIPGQRPRRRWRGSPAGAGPRPSPYGAAG